MNRTHGMRRWNHPPLHVTAEMYAPLGEERTFHP